jgi:hypothetical protein
LFGGGGDDDDDDDDEELVVSMSYSGKDANRSPMAVEEICIPAVLGKNSRKM